MKEVTGKSGRKGDEDRGGREKTISRMSEGEEGRENHS